MAEVYRTGGIADYNAAISILHKLKSNDSQAARVAPWLPISSGNVYVVRVENGEKALFWRTDPYKWNHLGTDKCPRKDTKIIVYRFQLRSFDVENRVWVPKDFYKKEYIHAASVTGTAKHKREVHIEDWGLYPYVIIEYSGTFNLDEFVDAQHGNTKSPDKTAQAVLLRRMTTGTSPKNTPNKTVANVPLPVHLQTPEKQKGKEVQRLELIGESETAMMGHGTSQRPNVPSLVPITSSQSSKATGGLPQYVRMDPRVRDKMQKEIAAGVSPINVYNNQVIQASKAGACAKMSTPSSKDQVYGLGRIVSKARKQDDLFNTYDLQLHTTDFFHELNLANGLTVVLCLKAISTHIEKVINVSSTVQFFYDTTFSVGDFYVSLLSMEHPCFRTKRAHAHPTVTVMALIHEFCDSSVHAKLFREAKRLMPSLNTPACVIVMDREPGISKAVKESCPEIQIFYFWRHMKENFERKAALILKNSDMQDAAVKTFGTLMHASSPEEYATLLEAANDEWPKALYNYYQKNIQEDFLKSTRWVLEKRQMYSQVSGITNNRAESANAAFKKMLLNKRADFARFSYATYFIQTRQLTEIHNGFQGFGDFIFESQYESFKRSIQITPVELEQAVDVVDESQIEPMIMHGKFPGRLADSTTPEPLLRENLFLEGEARRIIAKNKIDFLPHRKIYVVEAMAKQYFIVNLGKKTCTCRRKKLCAHLLAVMIANDISAETVKGNAIDAFNMGDMYRVQRNPRTGKKGVPIIRVPANKTAQVAKFGHTPTHSFHDKHDYKEISHPSETEHPEEDSDTSHGSATTEESNTEDSEILLGRISSTLIEEEATSSWSFGTLPIATSENMNSFIITVNGICLNIADIKSLDPEISDEEAHILNTDGMQKFEKGMLSSGIVSAFVKMITDDVHNVSISHFNAKKYFESGDNILTVDRNGLPYKWSNIKLLLIPCTAENEGWVVFAIKTVEKQICVFDPCMGRDYSVECESLAALLRKKYKHSEASWEVISKTCAEQVQPVSREDSGVCVLHWCANVLALDSMRTPLDIPVFRLKLLSEILGHCQLFNDKANCTICNHNEPPDEAQNVMTTRTHSKKLVCIRCESCVHIRCMGLDSRLATKMSNNFICQAGTNIYKL